MSLSSERQTVQAPLIRYATEAGWEYVNPQEALRLRRGESGIIFHEVLVDRLQRLNPGIVDHSKAQEIIRQIVGIKPNIEGNRDAWEYLRGLKTIFVETEKRDRNVRLIDPDTPEANVFQVTDEFKFVSGNYSIRPDVVFLINGIPVIVIETKSATKIEAIAEAFDQIRRYHREGPELMAQAQIFALTQLSQFFYGATWNLNRRLLFSWRDEQAGDFETLVKTFVAPRRVLRVLSDYILFVRKDGELSKSVLRPHQIRAVERALMRARDEKKHRGLIWHTQGSGKTYTMITIAKKLLDDPTFQNPTVLMIVDRNELQQQLFSNLEAVNIERVKLARSKKELRQFLENDTRGLIVSMIHKFDDMPPNMCTRKNVFVLIDEAHRSTGADLGNYLMGALPNATFIGFTGTPIDKTAYGKGTFKTFGLEDEAGYLDKYSIKESIADGTTVPLHYQMAPTDLMVDKETMEKEFWQVAELEGVSEVEELDRVLDRAVTLKNMLKNPERVQKIARFVANHYKEYVEPMGYKAFLVAVDREACCLYKEALDQYMKTEESAVVISPFYNDPEHIKKYHLSEEREKTIRKEFKKSDSNPKILIVTEKLLTGYDAPILYCMYLDKPMRDHVLLQAIARVNRPYETNEGQRKISGLIIDFVGIFEKLERALAFDSKDVEGVIEDIDVLRDRFRELIKEGQQEYLSIGQGLKDDKKVEAILEYFRDKDRRDKFYKFFRELEEVYEILSPDAFLRPFMNDYDQLVEMYRLVRSAYEPGVPVDKSFLRKTAEIVQRHTHTSRIESPHEKYEIGIEALEAMAGKEESPTVKIFNLLNDIHGLTRGRGKQDPYLIPIGERAEQIRQMYENHLASAEEALKELIELIKKLKEAEKEIKTTGLSKIAFAAKWWLETQKIEPDKAEKIANDLDKALHDHPHWATSEQHEREVRRKLYKAMLGAGIKQIEESSSSGVELSSYVDHLLDLLKRAI